MYEEWKQILELHNAIRLWEVASPNVANKYIVTNSLW